MDWDGQFGPSPTLDPEVLAETWQPEQVRNNLQPLVDGYRAWIQEQQLLVAGLSEAQQPVAEAHLRQCRRIAERIQEAIEILATDEDVRLAFCFANKAIALQSQWARGGTELEFVIMVIAVSCVKLLSAHNSTQHTSRKHKV
jgi:hypothetical protein